MVGMVFATHESRMNATESNIRDIADDYSRSLLSPNQTVMVWTIPEAPSLPVATNDLDANSSNDK